MLSVVFQSLISVSTIPAHWAHVGRRWFCLHPGLFFPGQGEEGGLREGDKVAAADGIRESQ